MGNCDSFFLRNYWDKEIMNRISFVYIFFACLCYNSYAQQSINYTLKNSCIESVSYSLDSDSQYAIFIQMTPDCALEFKIFTSENIGKSLQVLKNGHLIVEAVIRGEIDSGLISIDNLQDSKEVLEYLKILIE